MDINTVRDLLRSQGYDALQLVERMAGKERQVLTLIKSGSKVYLADHLEQYVEDDVRDVTIPNLVSKIQEWLRRFKVADDEIASTIADFKSRFGLEDKSPAPVAPVAPPAPPAPPAPKK